jgi:periplasmic copper chaperone A
MPAKLAKGQIVWEGQFSVHKVFVRSWHGDGSTVGFLAPLGRHRGRGSIMKVNVIFLSGALVAGVLFAANARAEDTTAGDLMITGAWCRAAPATSDLANCFVTIENKGAAADRLVGASTAAAEKVEIRQLNESGGGLTDKPVDGGLPISAGDKAVLAPGGYHIALMNTKVALKKGAKQAIDLQFDKAGKATVNFDVLAASSKGPPAPKAGATMMKKK